MLDNSSGGPWLVQKFGGTSVGKFPHSIAKDIVCANLTNNRVVVVSSARSTGKKAEGTTSRLLAVYEKLRLLPLTSRSSDRQREILAEAEKLIAGICENHVAAARAAIVPREDSDDAATTTQALQNSLIEAITAECTELSEYITAACRFKLEVDSRAKDRVVSFGEKLACHYLTALLKHHGADAEYVDLGDVLVPPTPSSTSAPTLDHDWYKAAAESFRDRIVQCGTRIPVVTGFFGSVPGGLMDGDIGRGYTDLCAALCAVGLQAEELQVWKEVDGIFTADPSKVPTARLLPSITPSEAAELTFYGSEVIHHLTLDQVIRATPPIPIRIKNVKNPRGHGTAVLPNPDQAPGHPIERATGPPSRAPGMETPITPSGVSLVASSSPSSSLSLSSLASPSPPRKPKRPTAVTIKDNIAVINVHSNKRSISHGFFAGIFSILNRHRVSVDLVSTSEVHVSMAVHWSAAPSVAAQLERAIEDLRECGDVSVIYGMAILSLVGAEMKNMIGIAGRMFQTLGKHSVNIEMISQGASEINISCVIEARDATRAMTVLHTNLFTFLD